MGMPLDMATAPPSPNVGDTYRVKSTALGSHLLQIDGYSIAKHAPNGTILKSSPFTAGGRRWFLYLFPNGDTPGNIGFMSVLLALGEQLDGRAVRLQLELSFIDEVHKHGPAHLRTRQVIDLGCRYGVGYRRFISREDFENSGHLKGDCFTIRCDFMVMDYATRREYCGLEGHFVASEDPASPAYRPRGYRRNCVGCNLRMGTLAGKPLIHVCLCAVCKGADASDGVKAKHCPNCHGPLEGRYLPLSCH